jgi:catechol 2,3-dioxygenase-like lactoylglutathione lyase family enzyme
MASPITGIAYARLSAPDLDIMQGFLEDFGLIPAHRDAKRLYMRGAGDSPFLHVTELGPPGTIAFGYDAVDESVLREFVAAGAAKAIEDIDEPGGGKRVVLSAPGGFEIEIVSGREKVAPLSPRERIRAPSGASMRIGPSRVRRLAHGVLATPRLDETIEWYNKTLRLIPSDELYVGTTDNRLGMFSRLDQGEQLVDHHVVFVVRGANAGAHHISFEVEDVDDIFVGHDHLKRLGKYEHIRGIGRHALGCQIFDYWMSPFEQMHEHWSSSERMNVHSSFNAHRVDANMGHDHGEKPTPRFVKHASPFVARPSRR